MPYGNALLDFVRTAPAGSKFRLAPTPSGYLHIGNAFNFVFNWLAARISGASLMLRIDDLDADRKRPEYVQDIFDSLHWLGLGWDEGPQTAAEFEEKWSQHTRMLSYFEALETLRAKGLLFACRKSRRELAAYDNYPAVFRDQGLSLDDDDVAWRIRTDHDLELRDFIVRRRDGIPAYQIASVVDDLHFGVTHVIRGTDLQPSGAAQLFLARCLSEPRYLDVRFLYHPLITDASGEKLSKSEGADSLKALRSQGGDAGVVFRQMGAFLGLEEPHPATADELEDSFRLLVSTR